MAKAKLVRAEDGFDLPPLNMEEGTTFGWYDRWQVGMTQDGKFLTDYSDWEARDMFEMLSKDYKGRQMESVLTLPISSAEYSIVAAAGDKGEAQWLADYWDADKFSGGCRTSLDEIIDLLTSAFAYRRAYFEKVWTTGTGKFKGKTVYEDIAFRPQTTCRLMREPKNGRFAGFEQEGYYVGPNIRHQNFWPIKIPPARAFVFTHGTRRDPLNGASDMEIAFWAWKTKQKVLLLWFQFLQGTSLPRIVVKGQDIGTATKVAQQIARMKASGVLPVTMPGGPDSIQTEILDSSGKGAEQFQQVIQWLDNAATQSILAGFLSLTDRGMQAVGGATGSYAMHSDASDFFLQSLEAKAREIERQVRSGLFAPLIRHNFGKDAAIPKLVFEPLNTVDKQTAVNLLTAAMAAPPGGPIPTDFIAGLAEQVSNYIGLDGADMKDSFKASFDAAAAQAKAEALQNVPGGDTPTGQAVAGLAGAVTAAEKAVAAGHAPKKAEKRAMEAVKADRKVSEEHQVAKKKTADLMAQHTDDSLRAKTSGEKKLDVKGAEEPVTNKDTSRRTDPRPAKFKRRKKASKRLAEDK